MIQFLFNVVGLSSFYLLFAVGLALVFGVMKVINFAHGELYMLGGYTVWIFMVIFGKHLPLPVVFVLALVIAPLIVGGVGVLLERGMFRPLRVNPFAAFVASLGLAYVLQVLVVKIFGSVDKSLPIVLPGVLNIWGGVIPKQRIVVISFAILMMGGLWYFLMRTRLGRGIRATAQDSDAARLQGIRFNQVSALTMGVGAGLAAISGALMASVIQIGPFMGIEAIWKAFIIVIVGGMSSIGGVALAALLFGFLDSLIMTVDLHQFVVMIDALIMLIVLAFRPHGLLGRGT